MTKWLESIFEVLVVFWTGHVNYETFLEFSVFNGCICKQWISKMFFKRKYTYITGRRIFVSSKLGRNVAVCPSSQIVCLGCWNWSSDGSCRSEWGCLLWSGIYFFFVPRIDIDLNINIEIKKNELILDIVLLFDPIFLLVFPLVADQNKQLHVYVNVSNIVNKFI